MSKMLLKDLEYSPYARRLNQGPSQKWIMMLLIGILTLCVQSASGADAERQSQETKVHIGWGDWDKWICQDMCGNSSYVRRRMCVSQKDSLCVGNNEMTKPGLCVSNVTCPEDCPDGRYGVDCWGECGHCTSECNRSTGQCSACEPGWQEPITGCDTDCPMWTYGNYCSNLCEIKCGGFDCINRIDGQCPEKTDILPYLLVLILVPFIILLLFLIASPRKRQPYRSRDYQTRARKIKRWKMQLNGSRYLYGQHARAIHHVTKPLRHEDEVNAIGGQSGDWANQVLVSPGTSQSNDRSTQGL